jgi:hypothetical protein
MLTALNAIVSSVSNLLYRIHVNLFYVLDDWKINVLTCVNTYVLIVSRKKV